MFGSDPIDQSNHNVDRVEIELSGRPLYIVRDHPTALLCWLNANRQGIIGQNCCLVHIDKHTDFTLSRTNQSVSQGLLKMSYADQRDFVSKKLHSDHSEFIVNGMSCELIQDGVSVSFDFSGHMEGECLSLEIPRKGLVEYTDLNGLIHKFYILSSTNLSIIDSNIQSISPQTVLLDSTELKGDLILDIDLDYFTRRDRYNGAEKYVIRNDIDKQLKSKNLERLFQDSKVITIALEPCFCGSMSNSLDILGLLEQHIPTLQGLNMRAQAEARFKE